MYTGSKAPLSLYAYVRVFTYISEGGRVSDMRYHAKGHIGDWARKALSGPFTLLMAIPLVFLDICLEIYHHTAFRLLGIPRVPRANYVRIDRHKLAYLTPAQKLFCAYCGYANGLLPYAVRIAAESEKYWCAVMHASHGDNDTFITPPHHRDFLPHNDKDAYTSEWRKYKTTHTEQHYRDGSV